MKIYHKEIPNWIVAITGIITPILAIMSYLKDGDLTSPQSGQQINGEKNVGVGINKGNIIINNNGAAVLEKSTEEIPEAAIKPAQTENDGRQFKTKDKSTSVPDNKSAHVSWHNSARYKYVTWIEAQAYCENLNTDGYENWRLPTRAEFENQKNIISTIQATLPNKDAPDFWTATSFDETEADLFDVDKGNFHHSQKNRAVGYVVCIRPE